MRGIRILPADWSEDVIQEVALKHPKRFLGWRGTTFHSYRSWLRTFLLSTAKDMRIVETAIRGHRRAQDRPKVFLDLQDVVLGENNAREFWTDSMD